MKLNLFFKIAALLFCFITVMFFLQKKYHSSTPLPVQNMRMEKTSGAGKSLDAWYFERAYPFDDLPASKYVDAFEQHQISLAKKSDSFDGEWENLGPENVGGRTLCLAFHPTDPDVIFAGSASGGLWKTTTQGIGKNAWEQIPTGFPVLGVAAIAIDQNNPDIMFIGTGETYGVGISEPGIVRRLTRGTYGIGILKSTDGGDSWSHVLEYKMNEIKGVQDIEISNQNSLEIYAATTDGVYQSFDGGDNWALIFAEPNCIDLEIDPNNGDIIYVTSGNFNYSLDPSLSGIFKSTNKGESFNELLDAGLLTAWSGSAKLTIDPSNSNTIYADIQVGWFNTNPTTPAGIYKSTNTGTNWTLINNQNIAQFQGWYSHDIAINPTNTSEMMYVGIDAWKSTDAGNNFIKKSDWMTWPFGEIPVDVPEGGPNYVHADMHAVYYHPLVPNKIFIATDGGVFSSADNGETFVTNNGGLQTTQFYANMGNSATNPDFCIAGAQDNATYIYRGNSSWWRVIGGDGMSASVNQDDDQIVYGSSQGLFILKSIDGGDSFFVSTPTLLANDFPVFSAPYEIAPTNSDLLYAGATFLYKSTDAAEIWAATSNQPVDGPNAILKIAVSPFDPDIVYVSTAPNPFSGTTPAKILKSIDGGQSFTPQINGLPDRVCKDIEFDPTNDEILYAVFFWFCNGSCL